MIKERKFGGKVYRVFDWCATKQEAVREAKAQRKAGKLARLTKATEGYQVWVR